MPRDPVTIRQAVLLVGGRGTRMWPLTATVPKGLIPVAGIPFLDLQLRQLASIGVEEILLAVGRHQLDAWEEFAASRSGVGLVIEEEPLDTAGPVRAALDDLDERFLVLNGDVVLEADLAPLLAAADPDMAATLALVEVDDTSAYGVVVVAGGLVERFVEKPPREEAPARTVNAGMYVMSRQALAGYPVGSLSFERTVFPDLVASGALGATTIDGEWLDIGTPSLYLECTGALLQGRSRLASIEGPHLVEGEAAGVGGTWAWVGAGATVADDAVVVDSVVLPGARVESGASVTDAIIGWEATVGAGARVGGASMVGAGAVVGAGCELDHGARIAPGTTLDPGSVTFTPPQ